MGEAAVMVLECGQWVSDGAAGLVVRFDHSAAPALRLRVSPPLVKGPPAILTRSLTASPRAFESGW